ncbi:hypothetical protein H2203_006141 [Taxawa tesnikishii (nom. ined.)]|nr:hypothetical protein H2203_006141 [Dothideales sp. JES 119]
MADDIAEILAHEAVKRVTIIGHDWGSYLAQRVYLWHPELRIGLVMLNVANAPPLPAPFDLPAMLPQQAGEESFFAYWELFTASDGARVIEAHLHSFYDVLHLEDQELYRRLWTTRGAFRGWLEADKRLEPAQLRPYARDEGFKAGFIKRIGRDGMGASLLWYVAYKDNVTYEAEKEVPKGRGIVGLAVLYLGCTGDTVATPDSIEPTKQAGLLPALTVKTIESGHWCMVEKPAEVGKVIANLVQGERVVTRDWRRCCHAI